MPALACSTYAKVLSDLFAFITDQPAGRRTKSHYIPLKLLTDCLTFFLLPRAERERARRREPSLAHPWEARAMRKRTDAPMTQALTWFHDQGLEPDQPTEHQLKYGDANFYPRKGTIFVDGEIARRDKRGLAALAAVLRELGYL